MKRARVIKNLGDGCYPSYSLQRTAGTDWAKEHLKKTFKRTLSDGTRMMLIPVPKMVEAYRLRLKTLYQIGLDAL